MMEMVEKREGPDRRRRPRGGRRPTDLDGAAPLVMVVDPDPARRDISHAILARLKFAVALVESVERAVAVVESLHPEVIVVGEADAGRLALALEGDTGGGAVPIVTVGGDTRASNALIDAVRRALRPPSA